MIRSKHKLKHLRSCLNIQNTYININLNQTHINQIKINKTTIKKEEEEEHTSF